MANERPGEGVMRGGRPHYTIVWFDTDWNEIARVTNCTNGEVVTHAVNFVNARRKISEQPELYNQSPLKESVGFTVQEEPRG